MLRAMRKAADEIIPAAVADDPVANKVWQSYSAFQQKVLERGLIMDGAVWQMRAL
jgi:TRAP-type mannitol/chloroaromatic compound transport system substrate-binding protein